VIRAVAWDIDGTLIDSEPTHHAALMQISARYGVAVALDDPRFVGIAMEGVWETLRPLYPNTLSREQWLDEIVTAYVGAAAALTPFAGAHEAIAALAQAGVRQACVSNSVRRVVEANLALLDLPFEFAIAREDVNQGKPDPEPYALACRRFGLAPGEVLAVEDSDAGAASARAAGLRVLRVGAGVFEAVVAQCTPLATPWMK
jgi:HAD superfamily hydrolase (TIGR01509 family)